MLNKNGCGGFLIIASVAMAWAGVETAHLWATNRQPAEVPCAEYEPHLTEATWIRLTDCQVDLTTALALEDRFFQRIMEVFIPIHSPGAMPDRPTHLVVSTRDPETVDLLEAMAGLRNRELSHFVAQNRERLFKTQTIEGLFRIGRDLSPEKRQELKAQDSTLVEGFKILDQGQQPTWRFILLILLAPAVLLFGLALCANTVRLKKIKNPIETHAERYRRLR